MKQYNITPPEIFRLAEDWIASHYAGASVAFHYETIEGKELTITVPIDAVRSIAVTSYLAGLAQGVRIQEAKE